MQKTTTEITIEYIKSHPYIKQCLKQGLINYSSLARLISQELNIEKKTSKEAILIAARRFHHKLQKEKYFEKQIRDILSNSEIEIKNKIAVFILGKDIDYTRIQKKIKQELGVFYIIEGSTNYTLITQDKYSSLIEKEFKVVKKSKQLAMLTFKSSKEIEDVPGVVAYITSLFSENGVNILEMLSCWKDSIFVIKDKDISNAINFLNF